MIDKYVKPEIDKYQLQTIGPSKSQELLNKLHDGLLSNHSVEIILPS